jgi:hypothetical protein
MEITGPQLPVQPPKDADSLRATLNLRVGRILQALAKGITAEGLLKLQIGSQELLAQTPTRISTGQPLTLRVEREGPTPELRLLTPSTPGALKAAALRQVLPRMLELAPALDRLSQTELRSAASPLSAATRELLDQLNRRLPSTAEVGTPAGLRRALQDSGLFTETMLARNRVPSGEVKTLLLRLAVRLRSEAPTPQTANSQRGDPPEGRQARAPATGTAVSRTQELRARPTVQGPMRGLPSAARTPPGGTDMGPQGRRVTSNAAPSGGSPPTKTRPPSDGGPTAPPNRTMGSAKNAVAEGPPGTARQSPAAHPGTSGNTCRAAPPVPARDADSPGKTGRENPQGSTRQASSAQAATSCARPARATSPLQAQTATAAQRPTVPPPPAAGSVPASSPHPGPSKTGTTGGPPDRQSAPPLPPRETLGAARAPLPEGADQAARGAEPKPGATSLAQLPAPRLVQELTRQVEGALSRIQYNQLASLPQEDGSRQVWQLDLPVRNAEGMDGLQLRIQQEPNHQGGKVTGASWSVNLAFDLEPLGPVRARIGLLGETVSSTFWAERRNTADLIRRRLDDLRQGFQQAGLEVGQLNARRGLPQEPVEDTGRGPLVDEQA